MSRRSSAERTIHHLHAAAERGLLTELEIRHGGLLQRVDPRAKVVGFAGFILAGTSSRSFAALWILLGAAIFLALASRLSIRSFTATGGGLTLALILAAPSVFLVPGEPAFDVPLLGNVTVQGLRSAGFLLLRVCIATVSSTLLILTTPWPHVLKALRVFRVPVVAIVILSMTYRYVFVLLRIATELFEARESRRVGRLSPVDQRQLIASGVGVLLSKSLALSEDVYMAMRSRGYQGEVYLLTDLRMQSFDWVFAVTMLAFALTVARLA
ncbi:MAG: cobalt ECF transporter T component CbiQ [Bryobacteraceae bacterium]|nr:cobalt ECF transporter T component CbiQ [Bryobacteraceae bacterium]